MSVRTKFVDLISAKYQALPKSLIEPLVSEQLLSPFKISLPRSVLAQAQQVVEVLFSMREQPEYLKFFADQLAARGLQDPGNKSILMSYDFHLDDKKNLKLIEINTNASFLALGDLMYQSHGLPQPVAGFSLDEIAQNIEEEMRLFGAKEKPQIAIVDDHPEKQRLYLEFLVYREFLKAKGFQVEIADFRNLPAKANFIYNRYTDFYLSALESKELSQDFLKRKKCFSPNPFEYFLLADKQRMIDWRAPEFLSKMNLTAEQSQILKTHTLTCVEVGASNADQLWAGRKKLFFKPKQAFGSKQTYRGARIAKKVFDEMIAKSSSVNSGEGGRNSDKFIAQEFSPAPEVVLDTSEGQQIFKYDLRFFAYKNRVQSVIARIYQGQVTNLQTPHGGFAPIELAP